MQHNTLDTAPSGPMTSPLAKSDYDNVATQALADGQNLPAMLLAACARWRDKPAFTNLGRNLSYRELAEDSAKFAAYLRTGLALESGARVAIMLPNLLQFPIALLGVLRADLIAVLVNPLYTARELRHQLLDSGAEVLIVLDNFGAVASDAISGTAVKHVITTRIGDVLPWPKSLLVDLTLKYVKKLIPDVAIAGSVPWLMPTRQPGEAMAACRWAVSSAVLQRRKASNSSMVV